MISWFTAGVIVNGIAILMVIINCIFDITNLRHESSHSLIINVFGLGLCGVIGGAYFLRSTGQYFMANLVLWIPAGPLLFLYIFTSIFVAIAVITKPDWR